MSATTIRVPAEQVEAIRESLSARREEEGPRAGVDDLLRQTTEADIDGVSELTASRALLWSAVYDSLCVAAEQLADECNDLWRVERGTESARSRLADVGARLELLASLD